MSKRDYYEVLGVEKVASEGEIKKAYRKLSKEHHPDKGGNEELFKEVAEAYGILSDSDKRANYDRYGHDAPRGQQGMSMDEILRQMQRQHQPQRRVRRGSNLRVNIQLTLEDVYKGLNKKIKYSRLKSCVTCDGKGGEEVETCGACKGSGIEVHVQQTPIGLIQHQMTCTHCGGNGEIPKKVCGTCKGSGVKKEEDFIDIDIPSGVANGDVVQFDGRGNAVKNGINGSLEVLLSVLEHDQFEREGANLRLYLELHYPQLVLGDKVEVKTIEGKTIRFEVPEFSKDGDVIRIPEKGLNYLQTRTRGDLYIQLEAIFPTQIDDEDRENLKIMKDKLEVTKNN